jgi:hypothetical protein
VALYILSRISVERALNVVGGVSDSLIGVLFSLPFQVALLAIKVAALPSNILTNFLILGESPPRMLPPAFFLDNMSKSGLLDLYGNFSVPAD